MKGTRIASNGVTHLWERHKHIARCLLAGKSMIETAKIVGYTPVWVSVVSNSPVFKKYLDSLRSRVEEGLVDVREELVSGAQTSVKLLKDLMKDSATNPQTKAKIAMDFLDRAGYGAVKTVRNENLNVTLNANRLEELKQKRDEMLRQSRLDHTVIEAQIVNG